MRNACDTRWRSGDALNALLDLLPRDLAYELDLIVWLSDTDEELPGWLYSALKRAQVKLQRVPGSRRTHDQFWVEQNGLSVKVIDSKLKYF